MAVWSDLTRDADSAPGPLRARRPVRPPGQVLAPLRAGQVAARDAARGPAAGEL